MRYQFIVSNRVAEITSNVFESAHSKEAVIERLRKDAGNDAWSFETEDGTTAIIPGDLLRRSVILVYEVEA